MPQTGGPINRPKPVKKVKPPKPVTQVTERAVDAALKVSTAAQKSGERKTARIKKSDVDRFLQAPSGGTVDKARKSFDKTFTADRKADRQRADNAKTFGFKDTGTAPARTKRSGGTATGGLPDRTRRDHTTIADRGAQDGGRLGGGFADRNLVGSDNTITEFDGSEFSGGANEVAGGGGGSGSSLAGRESVGLVGQVEGQSMEEVVYGVQKKGRKTKQRGLGE